MLLFLASSAILLTAACKDETPPIEPPPSQPPLPAKPAPPTPVVDGGVATDAKPLSMMEKHAIWKAMKEADEKLAARLAAEEKARLIKFDKSKLPKLQALFAFEQKTRQALDQETEKLNGKLDAEDQLKKFANSQRKGIEAQAAALLALDPKGAAPNRHGPRRDPEPARQ